MFYAVYMLILFHLPNAKFYPEMERFDALKLDRTVRNIAAYAMLEFASLLYVHAFLRWELHLLAKVLEREYIILQSVFVIWVLVVLQMLQHTVRGAVLLSEFTWSSKLTVEVYAGVDLSFKFKWS